MNQIIWNILLVSHLQEIKGLKLVQEFAQSKLVCKEIIMNLRLIKKIL